MKDEEKTKEQLINELTELRRRVTKLEAAETERKQAEEALRESEERYRKLFEQTFIGIISSGPDGNITSVNPNYYAIALEELGYRVTVVTNGAEALERFRAHPEQFDFVFTDEAMPKMTGVHLSQELLRIRPDIPIILATGYSDTVSEETAKAPGIRQFLMKPININTLTQIIRELCATKGRIEH